MLTSPLLARAGELHQQAIRTEVAHSRRSAVANGTVPSDGLPTRAHDTAMKRRRASVAVHGLIVVAALALIAVVLAITPEETAVARPGVGPLENGAVWDDLLPAVASMPTALVAPARHTRMTSHRPSCSVTMLAVMGQCSPVPLVVGCTSAAPAAAKPWTIDPSHLERVNPEPCMDPRWYLRDAAALLRLQPVP